MDHVFAAEDFLQSLDGDRGLAVELVRAYMEDSPVRLGQIRHALESRDLEMLIQTGHSLKGMSGVVRAQKVVELTLLMEAKAQDGDFSGCAQIFEVLHCTLKDTLESMRAFL